MFQSESSASRSGMGSAGVDEWHYSERASAPSWPPSQEQRGQHPSKVPPPTSLLQSQQHHIQDPLRHTPFAGVGLSAIEIERLLDSFKQGGANLTPEQRIAAHAQLGVEIHKLKMLVIDLENLWLQASARYAR